VQSITISGFKPEIYGTNWLANKATHTISGSADFITPPWAGTWRLVFAPPTHRCEMPPGRAPTIFLA